MRNQLFTPLLMLFFSLSLSAQKVQKHKDIGFINQGSKTKPQEFNMSKLEYYFSYIPAGSYTMEDGKNVSIKSFYMLRFEVPNMLYRMFINDLNSKGKTEELIIARPDTLAWGSKNQPYVEIYFSHPVYNSYPVVSVPRKGVELFCMWLQDQLKICKLKEWKDKKITFRLPTEAEWMFAASAGDTNAVYAWHGPYTRMGNGPWSGDYMANFCRTSDANLFRDENGKLIFKKNENHKYQSYFAMDNTYDITAPVNNYWPNDYGLYCMTGNVREMVIEEGFTKGGSWIDPGGECMIDFRNTYHREGAPCEGFRIVAIVE